MKNTKSWIIIGCLIGAAIVVLFTNLSVLNKVLVIAVAVVGSLALLTGMKKA